MLPVGYQNNIIQSIALMEFQRAKIRKEFPSAVYKQNQIIIEGVPITKKAEPEKAWQDAYNIISKSIIL